MTIDTLYPLLREHPFLRGLSDEQVRFIVSCAKNVRLAPGQFLFREGGEAGALFLLREGSVSLEVHHPSWGTIQMESLGPGDLVGISWFFPPHKWALDARARTQVAAFAFDAECLRKKMEEQHDFGYAFARLLLYQLHRRLERVRMQRLDLYAKEPS